MSTLGKNPRDGNVLFFSSGGLGDTCHIMPILYALKEGFPSLRVELTFGSRGAKDFAKVFFPEIDGIVTSESNQIERFLQLWGWRKKHFDYFISGASLDSWKTALCAYLISSNKSVGLSDEKASFLYDVITPAPESGTFYDRYTVLFTSFGLTLNYLRQGNERFRHEIQRISHVNKPMGVNKKRYSFRIALSNGADTIKRGRWKPSLKRVPNKIWERLFGRLKSQISAEILLLGVDKDPFPEQMRLDPCVTDLRGKTTFEELISILKDIDLLISNDTGTLHLAHFCDAPYLGLFGPTDPETFAPEGYNSNIIQSVGDCISCRPNPTCGLDYCEMLTSLDINKITSRVNEILKKEN